MIQAEIYLLDYILQHKKIRELSKQKCSFSREKCQKQYNEFDVDLILYLER